MFVFVGYILVESVEHKLLYFLHFYFNFILAQSWHWYSYAPTMSQVVLMYYIGIHKIDRYDNKECKFCRPAVSIVHQCLPNSTPFPYPMEFVVDLTKVANYWLDREWMSDELREPQSVPWTHNCYCCHFVCDFNRLLLRFDVRKNCWSTYKCWIPKYSSPSVLNIVSKVGV